MSEGWAIFITAIVLGSVGIWTWTIYELGVAHGKLKGRDR